MRMNFHPETKTWTVPPEIVLAPGQYKTRCGEVVTINSVKLYGSGFVCQGAYPNGIKESWNRQGCVNLWTPSKNDIVAKV